MKHKESSLNNWIVLRVADAEQKHFIVNLLKEHVGHPIRYIDTFPEICNSNDHDLEEGVYLKVVQ